MSRILLADDSPQALRLAEQILRPQGFEVVSVTDGAVALRRLADVDPDLVIADVFLPTKNGFDLVRYLKAEARHRHIGMIFAAAPADQFNEEDARNAGADAILRKPFEASALLSAVHQLVERSRVARASVEKQSAGLDRTTVRAAVTLAIEAAVPTLVDELTERVILALNHRP